MTNQPAFAAFLEPRLEELASVIPPMVDNEPDPAVVARLLGTLQRQAGQLAGLIAYVERRAAGMLEQRVTDWPDGMRAEVTRSRTVVWDDTETARALCADLLVDGSDRDGDFPRLPEAVWRILAALPKNHGWLTTEVGKYAGNLDDLRATSYGHTRVRVTLPKAEADELIDGGSL